MQAFNPLPAPSLISRVGDERRTWSPALRARAFALKVTTTESRLTQTATATQTREGRYQAHLARIAGTCREIIETGMAASAEPMPSPAPLPCPVAQGEALANIGHVFETLCAGHSGFGLMACNVDGQSAAMIVLHRIHRGQIEVAPCFVSFVPGMVVRDAEGVALFGGP